MSENPDNPVLSGAGWKEDALILAAFKAECDAVGIPYDPAGLVRHHRGNAGMVAALDTMRDTEALRQAVKHLLAMVEGRTWQMTRDGVEVRCSSPVGPDEPCGECVPCWARNVERSAASVRELLTPTP